MLRATLNLIQLLPEQLFYSVTVFLHFVVPHAHDAEALCFESCGALGVVLSRFIGGVLSAVEFENQPAIETNKVRDVIAKWYLTAELVSRETTTS